MFKGSVRTKHFANSNGPHNQLRNYEGQIVPNKLESCFLTKVVDEQSRILRNQTNEQKTNLQLFWVTLTKKLSELEKIATVMHFPTLYKPGEDFLPWASDTEGTDYTNFRVRRWL